MKDEVNIEPAVAAIAVKQSSEPEISSPILESSKSEWEQRWDRLKAIYTDQISMERDVVLRVCFRNFAKDFIIMLCNKDVCGVHILLTYINKREKNYSTPLQYVLG